MRKLALVGLSLLAAGALAVGGLAAASRHGVVRLSGFPENVGGAYGSIWALSHRGGWLYRVDPQTARVTARIDVASALCWSPVAAGGRLWAPGCDDAGGPVTYAVDPRSNKVVSKVRGYDPSHGDHSLWTVDLQQGRLYRIDPKSGLVVATIRPPGLDDGSRNGGVAYGSFWFITSKTVVRISTATNKVTNVIALPNTKSAVFADGEFGPSKVAAVGGKLWVVQYPGLYEIDPGTNQAVLTSYRVGSLSQWGDVPLAAKNGLLWTRLSDSPVMSIDPTTHRVKQRYPATGGGGGLDIAFGSLWIANAAADTVWHTPVS